MALLELIALFVLARLLGAVAERGKVPSLAGEIAAGLVLGPLLLGFVQPTDPLKLVADLGVFFIVYEAGMEMTLRGVRRAIKESGAAVAAGSFALPFLLGYLVGLAFGFDARPALFLGLALSLTALPVSIRILTDLGWVNTDVGQAIITAGLLCDIAGLTVLAALSEWTGAAFGVMELVIAAAKIGAFFVAVVGIERILAAKAHAIAARVAAKPGLANELAGFSVPVMIAFGFALLAELLGLHFVIGVFFGSVLVAEHVVPRQEGERVRHAVNVLSRGFLAPLFFAYLGLVAVTWDATLTTLFVALLLAAILGKLAGSYAGARFGGFGGWSATAIAFGMNGRGAMELVIALVGLELGIIAGPVFSILVVLGLVTTLMTPVLLRGLSRARERAIAEIMLARADPPRST